MSCLIVIPARWGSTRLPGKPLVPIAGRPLLARVVDVVKHAVRGLSGVDMVVATDDCRVARLAATLDCRVTMTDSGLASGSARALAAARLADQPPATIVNVQGDAPFTPPAVVADVIAALAAGAAVATPVRRLAWVELDALRLHKQRAPFSGTTCVTAPDGTALWFSKQIIPAMRDEVTLRAAGPLSPVRQHLGLYGYTLEALTRFEAAPSSRYEQVEGLEQLRFFDLRIPITTIETAPARFPVGGIDTPADVERAEHLIRENGEFLAS